MLLGCSEQPIEYKLNKEYSNKISSNIALSLLEFTEIMEEYDKLAFKSNESSEREELLGDSLFAIQERLSVKIKELSKEEKIILNDIMFSYNTGVSLNVSLLKSSHKLALINKDMDNNEYENYINIDDAMKEVKETSSEILNKLDKYLEK
ncbi:hypothetical protein [Paenibacillus endoradicis]|uniref:hypothetical protein n=1 Tax=Paenibacillus endoradicis TaxID=2972487 RepID=UPI0021598252|nr:hypothetical protein [Paenibacillus endoradicis]MCR8656038.1 hypothetical protein [Paenibacillus endoradicis]MCR8658364.1 hypothetical protein [Paenibacillus endoradicis]